ncbi:glycoside hydrolase [Pontibacter harenae]|uniref:glycoside hydrolase n=1 Tax=Pontibacter harenae TaxID=2894083 RepID=UPI001E583211|nr:glycoside hydrolase [Pontibacter harenae]MCC9168697.1 xylanase [Pontibacter harenae]
MKITFSIHRQFVLPILPHLITFLALGGCSVNNHEDNAGQGPTAVVVKEVTANINVAETYQTIDNFAASDAWACQFIGNWPDAKKNAIADLLFSTDTSANGQPKGIGLSMWRFNIGAGSAEQGEQSGIRDEWRRAESFLEPDGSYDWQRQAGQVWFLKAAQERGVKQFLAFPNSPPVNLTKNGKAFASDGKPNLAPEKYNAFADYLAEVAQGVERVHNVSFRYISPVNEPQWDWSDGGQEGTPFMNENIAGIVKALNTSFERKNVDATVDVAEAGKIDYLYATEDKPNRGNQIDAFFNSSSPLYIGDLSHVGNIISGHSYFTTSPFNQAVDKRERLANKVASVPGLKFWQSEYCILGDNAGEIEGNKRDLGIDPAIYMARVIHNDLAVANATAWQWWLAVSPYNYKDGLVYVDKNKTDGNYYDSKMLWALGNYSFFIRSGATRVGTQLTGEDSEDNILLASSYIDAANHKLITVAVNAGIRPIKMKLNVQGGGSMQATRTYVTTASNDLKPGDSYDNKSAILLAPRSVTTMVTEMQ